MAVLDTSVLVNLSGRGGKRRTRQAQSAVAELAEKGENLATTRFNVAELWVGIEHSNDPDAERQKVERLLLPLVILDFDASSARAFGRITAFLQKRGRPIGDTDALIAAVGLVNGHPILTRNPAHFQAVPSLPVISY